MSIYVRDLRFKYYNDITKPRHFLLGVFELNICISNLIYDSY
jgi:hypothetical protein